MGKLSFNWIAGIFQNISEALTVDMRMFGNGTDAADGTPLATNQMKIVFAGNQNIVGTAFINSVCVHVRWGRLTYPASLILLTCLYLITTMFDHGPESKDSSSKSNIFTSPGVWKSSILPLMFHGLDGEHLRQNEPFRLTPLRELERTAKRTKTRLIATYSGWKFVKTD